MKNITFSLLLIFSICSFHYTAAQKRTLDLAKFTEASLGTPGKLYIKQGAQSVQVECSDKVFENIEFKLSGDRLVIQSKNSWGWSGISNSDLTIYITMETIEGLSISGSGEIIGEQKITADDLKLRISGSGDIALEASANNVYPEISGSGEIKLGGKAKRMKARISGSGSVKAENMSVDTTDASISGSGSVYVTANEEIDAQISGSGNVFYKGDPQRRNANSSGSGKIKKMD